LAIVIGLLPGSAGMAEFAAAVLVLNATPGVDFVLTVSRTLHGGPRSGTAAVLGINVGCVVHVLAAAFGLAALLALHPAAFDAIRWAGALYLLWLGLMPLRDAFSSRPAEAVIARGAERSGFGRDFRTGLLTNVLNPKVALFMLAFVPQFVPSSSTHPTLAFLLLGTWFVLQSLLFNLLLVALAARISRLQSVGRARRLLHAAGGALFIGLAVRVVGGGAART
jgi:threonine/homoserine/homoserine lactone efflux protein